jgi:hypothetical protein
VSTESASQRHCVKFLPQQPRRRRSFLDFGNHVQLIARERAGKIARGIRLARRDAQHGFGHNALPTRHFGAALLDDAAQDSSRLGFGNRHAVPLRRFRRIKGKPRMLCRALRDVNLPGRARSEPFSESRQRIYERV